MSETGRHIVLHQRREDEVLAEPPAISSLALVALVLGLAAALALAAPYLWLVPIAGAVVSVAALISIARDPVGKIGRPVAVAGLVLSLLFGAWAVSNHLTRQRLLYQQSEILASRWLQMVLDGDMYSAHQLKMGQDERRPPGTDLAAYYQEDTEAHRSFREFARQSPVAELAAMGPDAVCRHLRHLRWERVRDYGGPLDRIVQQFDVAAPGNAAQRIGVQIELFRSVSRWSGEAQWRVSEVKRIEG
jgi:hypothetical protein